MNKDALHFLKRGRDGAPSYLDAVETIAGEVFRQALEPESIHTLFRTSGPFLGVETPPRQGQEGRSDRLRRHGHLLRGKPSANTWKDTTELVTARLGDVAYPK